MYIVILVVNNAVRLRRNNNRISWCHNVQKRSKIYLQYSKNQCYKNNRYTVLPPSIQSAAIIHHEVSDHLFQQTKMLERIVAICKCKWKMEGKVLGYKQGGRGCWGKWGNILMHWRHLAAILEVKRRRNNWNAQICTRVAQDWLMNNLLLTSRWVAPNRNDVMCVRSTPTCRERDLDRCALLINTDGVKCHNVVSARFQAC